MRRLALIGLLLVAGAGATVSAGAGEDEKPTYTIVFDNASGLVEGGDLRVGGVTVGSIETFDVVPEGARAAVEVSVSDTGFGGLRRDARCKIAQQSLIGEYFVECEPGRSGAALDSGATIPVEQTESPIAFDLVQNIMRRPYRERLSIILSELGAGFAARGEDVNETIRRAVPALTETQRVLKILGDNRRVLRRLAADSGEVLKVLGDRRKDVSRFIEEAGDAAATTAERRDSLAETFRRFPGFLREFEPTLDSLGNAARQQAPALRDLRAASDATIGLLEVLPPFARASEPALESLGTAAQAGGRAAEEAESTVGLLRTLGSSSREPGKNLRMILEHLDDRGFATMKDPDSPGGAGYTGLEAILQYPFDQSLAFNIFDTRGYILKLNALINQCDAYTDAQEAKEDPERYKACAQGLGPNQPGITTPDPSAGTEAQRQATRTRAERATPERRQATPAPERGTAARPAAPAAPDAGLPLPKLPETTELLDFLLGP